MAALVVFVACCAYGKGQSSQDSSGVLQRVAQAYAAITDYAIGVARSTAGGDTPIGDSGDSIADQPSSNSVMPGGFIPTPSVRMPLVNKILIARSGAAFHYEIDSFMRLVWITDGRTTWEYRSNLNQYTERPSVPWPDVVGSAEGLPGIEWRYFSRFRAIAKMARHTKVLSDNVPADSTCPGGSTRIELQIANNAGETTEQLRILKANDLVCESILRRRLISGGGIAFQTAKTSWDYKQTSGPVDPSLFTFTPPKKAKKVDAFKH